MPRPPLPAPRRRASCAARYFKPAGVPVTRLEEVALSVDELEALRLADLEGLYQDAAAARMGVSRPTFARIVEASRRKVAEALVHGRALRIGGGPVAFAGERRFRCEACGHEWSLAVRHRPPRRAAPPAARTPSGGRTPARGAATAGRRTARRVMTREGGDTCDAVRRRRARRLRPARSRWLDCRRAPTQGRVLALGLAVFTKDADGRQVPGQATAGFLAPDGKAVAPRHADATPRATSSTRCSSTARGPTTAAS